MGYVAVKGGTAAIEESIRRLKYERLKKRRILDFHNIEGGMRCLIDQVMSESSLYSETLAAISIKQAEGSPEEAVFLMRAYRSTLPRKHYTRAVHSENMLVERRISASFKDIPGGQILGAAYDYTHRLIDFDLSEETEEEIINWLDDFSREYGNGNDSTDLANLPKVLDYLREEGLIAACENNDSEPDDVTRDSVRFPASRSARLQILTRGQTGAVISLGYAALRSYGALHPTVGELRIGNLPLYVDNPFNEAKEDDDAYFIGEIKVTEVETLFPVPAPKENGLKTIEFGLGYGICYGQNETKAIAMSILDHCLEAGNAEYPTHNEEFVLLHIDSVESAGFISHLKLPHYVTFQSELDSVRKSKKMRENNKEFKP
ncbi:carbon-phosphorus lyase complex subunit PhnI [Pelotomaculum terephthalicicum JT]|uniref:carbon-phosphorus lyase complex subunit PhnI n=1 Tax=Pelotomaculum terephthalicicum TaxID=206393 RepID=UPI001F03CF1C|nr:carbon-phosphorus lyase complex subunit PhnI [Pelotomaculum terephthalicicum]MCG9968583.1 carbon-phosphorus lyase complex subunit PhnI [Pelotomaculum terephthalicicum JT]